MEYPDRPSRSPTPTPTPNVPEDDMIPEETTDGNRAPTPDLPLTMTASAVLTALPRDASAALASVGRGGDDLLLNDRDRKIIVRFKAVGGSAPQLRREVRKIGAAQRFETVVVHLRRALKLDDVVGNDGDVDGGGNESGKGKGKGMGQGQGLFCYVNSAFAPALDEVVGNLHRCFKDSNDQLIVAYSITPAFG